MKMNELLQEAKKMKAPNFTHFVEIKVLVDYTDEEMDDQHGKATIIAMCQSEEEAKEVVAKAKADQIDWSNDHDDYIHHVAQNAFDDSDAGYVDMVTVSAKLLKSKPDTNKRTTFTIRGDELLGK